MNPNTLPQLYEEFCSGELPTLPVNADGALATTLPGARVDEGVTVRVATLDDYPFIDMLQKMHTHMVGWFPKKQLETYIEGGWVLIAEKRKDSGIGVPPVTTTTGSPPGVSVGVVDSENGTQSHGGSRRERRLAVTGETPVPLGYIIFKDEYKRREDLGIVYQLNVIPMRQRSLIGARLVQEAFERSAYGCKLFCCWCAQDIQANFFWESIGFVPLGFRTGSRDKQRIHIFWQRRIDRERMAGGTPAPPAEYWFPYKTDAGAVREDRIVLPIPPGTNWRDAKPVIVPELPALLESDSISPSLCEGVEGAATAHAGGDARAHHSNRTLPGGAPIRPRPTTLAEVRSQSKPRRAVVSGGRVKYLDERDAKDDGLEARPTETNPRKLRKKSRPKAKHDPEHVRIARDVRDRYLEAVNLEAKSLPPGACGKWDVSRGIRGEATSNCDIVDQRLLEG